MMEKKWYKSKTIWGTILLSTAQVLKNVNQPEAQKVGAGLEILGIVLTGVGIRIAIGSNGKVNVEVKPDIPDAK